MASQEDLRRIYSPVIFGNHFNERPLPDAFGRVDATPLEIQQAMKGEFNLPPQQLSLNPRGRRERVIPEYERLRQEREQRKATVRAAKRR